MHAAVLAHLAADADTFIFFVLAPIIALIMVRYGSGGGFGRKRREEVEPTAPEETAQEETARPTAESTAEPVRPEELPVPKSERPPGGAV